MANILFIGLGNMGYPMAGHLTTAGHSVCVYNRTASRSEQWLTEFKGSRTLSLSEIPDNLDAVMLCVGRDDDVRNILCGEFNLLTKLPQGCLVIDHTTTSASLAEEVASLCETLKLKFCDAPVSGGQQGAINGQLTLMTGAKDSVFSEVKAITAPYTRAIEHMGEPGMGQKTKMVNQICVAGLIQSLAEGIHFAQNAGLDVEQVMQLLTQGAAGSWQMANRYKTMTEGEYDHGFAVNWMHKDLQICLSEAEKLNTDLPVTRIVDGYYQQLQAMNKGSADTSALLYRLQNTVTQDADLK